MKLPFSTLLAASIITLSAASQVSALDPVNATKVGNLAIKGYDPVAYFTAGKAVKGESQFSLTHLGATWRFASEANRDAFRTAPDRYAPQYGGYCAWAVSQGYTAGIDPKAWKIVNEKLYLNYSPSVQSRWARDIPGHIAKGDENWPNLLGGGR